VRITPEDGVEKRPSDKVLEAEARLRKQLEEARRAIEVADKKFEDAIKKATPRKEEKRK
jgi:hypothetical protein